jgi:hypothetical protein
VIELLVAGSLSHPFEIRTGRAWPDRISIDDPLLDKPGRFRPASINGSGQTARQDWFGSNRGSTL